MNFGYNREFVIKIKKITRIENKVGKLVGEQVFWTCGINNNGIHAKGRQSLDYSFKTSCF